MSEFNIEDLDAVIAGADSSLVQMLALQLKKQIGISKASEQQLAAVVAECASVKAMNDCLSEELRGYESDGAFEGPKMHLLWWQCETPATDAYLAEVRAQGVDMFALMFAEEAIKSNNITTGWRAKASREASEYAEALREDAAQLRKGAAL